MPTDWQGWRTIATRSAKACYFDEDETDELIVQIEMIRGSNNGTESDAEGSECRL
jgi:hypothetical protein